ncbi:hypothetical protein CCACVL1_18068 [Corchorus capsularis]|uniref:Uncharacterized protein n=1 Tax=Corchorus capsularis TaxID=210143 RepID=A0A1R3HN52_COCAP|nr:hypothetical protein CCACVL1_18068 [Corchorus capsularis]
MDYAIGALSFPIIPPRPSQDSNPRPPTINPKF